MEALENWKEEKRSAYLYNAIANIETDPVHQKLFQNLARMAERQAGIWEKSLQAANLSPPQKYTPDLRVRVVIQLVRWFGARSLRVALAALKVRGMSIYQGGDIGHPLPTKADEMEHRHHSVSKGNNLRAAVFGINDGLVSNASLILGIAGAHAGNHFILLSGIAGLLAGACSMGAGEYVSVRSQREMLEYQLRLEKNELELYPEEEAAELALIYEARGLSKEEAKQVAHLLIQDPEKALDTLAREELGINPKELASPWEAAGSSFFSFMFGALIPIVPFMFSHSSVNLEASIVLTAVTLFLVGAVMSLFTQRSAIRSGLRMLLIGALAGSFTYIIGSIFRAGLA